MNRRSTILAGAVAVAAVGVVTGALALRNRASGGEIQWPEGVIVATATVDIRAADTPEAVATQLATEPKLEPLFRAIRDGDVPGFLAQINWQPQGCLPRDFPRGAQLDLCPDGVATGTQLPMVNVSPLEDATWITQPTLEPYVKALLVPGALQLRYASRSRTNPAKYYLGFEGPSRGSAVLPVSGGYSEVFGIFLFVDTASSAPVQEMTFLTGVSSAAAAAPYLDARDPQEILTFVDTLPQRQTAVARTPSRTPLPSYTPTLTPTVTPTPDEAKATLRLEPAAVRAAVGETVALTLVARPAEPYRGYQWSISVGPPLRFVAAASVTASGYAGCSDPLAVADGNWYAGCVTLGDPGMYAGPLATITLRCDARGTAEVRLLATAGGSSLGSALLRADGGESGWPSRLPVTVTCT